MDDQTPNRQTYSELLSAIKERIQSAQVRAAVAVNQELVRLYWGIGKRFCSGRKRKGGERRSSTSLLLIFDAVFPT